MEKTPFEKYGHFNSSHEVYGVLMEELAEFFDIVREKTLDVDKIDNFDTYHDKRMRMATELNQISQVANRACDELLNHKIKFV